MRLARARRTKCIRKRTATRVTAIAALAVCVIAALATDAHVIGGSVVSVSIFICVARSIVKRRTNDGGTRQPAILCRRTVVIGSAPLISLIDDQPESREPRVIDVEAQERQDRVRRWLKDAPGYFQIMRGILCDYDRLEKIAHDATQEQERLLRTAGALFGRLERAERDRERLQYEVIQLKAELERYRRDREEMAVSLEELSDGMDGLTRTLEQLNRKTPKAANLCVASEDDSAERGEPTDQ